MPISADQGGSCRSPVSPTVHNKLFRHVQNLFIQGVCFYCTGSLIGNCKTKGARFPASRRYIFYMSKGLIAVMFEGLQEGPWFRPLYPFFLFRPIFVRLTVEGFRPLDFELFENVYIYIYTYISDIYIHSFWVYIQRTKNLHISSY